MKDDVNILSDVFAVVRVTNITIQNLNFLQTNYVFQPAPIVEGVVLGQSFYLITLCDQHFSQMGSDEAVGTSNQDAIIRHCFILENFKGEIKFLKAYLVVSREITTFIIFHLETQETHI